jgi:hypothetical protein
MAEIRFPKIEIEPADLDRLEAIVHRFEEAAKNANVNVEGWQKALHERDDDILERNNVIALQEKLLREQREKMKALYEERDVLRQRLSEAEDVLDDCQWTESPDTLAFITECGGWFNVETGTPTENGMKFCPYCGKHLVLLVD